MGMVGGERGAFIGAVHRMAANLDGEIELTPVVFHPILRNPTCRVRICSLIHRVFIPLTRK
jgi:hypothetical protein